jgi:hypothetical protein
MHPVSAVCGFINLKPGSLSLSSKKIFSVNDQRWVKVKCFIKAGRIKPKYIRIL